MPFSQVLKPSFGRTHALRMNQPAKNPDKMRMSFICLLPVVGVDLASLLVVRQDVGMTNKCQLYAAVVAVMGGSGFAVS